MLRRTGLVREEVRPRRPPVPAALLTARVAALTYGPLMLVPSVVAVGTLLDGRLLALPVVVGWFVAGVAVSYVVLLLSVFLLRGHRWARGALAAVTILVLLVDLPLCWWLLGLDGLLRDGAPLAVAAALTGYALWRARRVTPPRTRSG
ncbi:MAG TPA: hypothetical protein VNV66_05965, partial [Pilimelia sp.]|nr:hypothetical protein [Pilimelia sp.]